MKESLWGIIGTLVAALSLLIQFIKEIKSNLSEKKSALSLKLCDQIEYDVGVYKIKIINVSSNATAYDLHATFRIKNNHLKNIYKLPDFNNQSDIYSINKDKEQKACEILINIDAMRIEKRYLEENPSVDINKLFEENKLELKHILANREMCLSVRYYAVNKSTGKTVDFDQHDFYYKDIASGRFGVGNDYVTQL